MSDYNDKDLSRLAKLRSNILSKAAEVEASEKENEQGIIGDSFDAVEQGLYGGAADIADGVRYLTGSETAGSAANFLRDKADDQIQQMSPEGRAAFQNFGIEKDDDSATGYGFKEGSNTKGFLLNALAGVGSFAPTMLPGTAIAKGIGLAGKVAGGAGKAAGVVGKGEVAAKTAEKAADIAGYGAVGSVSIGGSTANQAYQKIVDTDYDTLKDSQIFQSEYWKLRDKEGLDHEQALSKAREDIAKGIATEAAKDGAILGAISQGAIGPVFGKILRGETGGAAKSAATGTASEGAQEMIESGGQTYVSNMAVNPAVPTDSMDGVVGDALTGGLVGGPAGGVFGAVGGASRSRLDKSKKGELPEELSDSEKAINDIDSQLSEIDELLEAHEGLSNDDFDSLINSRKSLLEQRNRLLGDHGETGSVDMDGAVQEPLALPNQNIIYGEKPPLTKEQIRARESNQAAFEGQFGEPRNTGLEGEYLGKVFPQEPEGQSPGATYNGEVVPDPAQIEGYTIDKDAKAIEDSGIIYGEKPESSDRLPRSNGLTDPYTGPQPSRKNDDPVYQEIKRKQRLIEEQEQEAKRLRDSLKTRQQVEKQQAQQTQLDGLENKAEVRAAKGKAVKSYTPSNKPVDLEYQVVNADDLVTSNNDDLTPNTNYPQTLQNRDRTTDSSRNQINSIANKLIPEKLSESADVSTGSPIVRNGIVESGNARSLAIRKAYREGKAGAYKDYLNKNAQRFGIDPSELAQFDKPVLVRHRQTDMTAEELTAYTKDANTSEGQTLKPSEQAKSDAQRLKSEDLEMVNLPESGDISAPSNKSFVSKFLGRLSDNERAGLVGKDGALTQHGATRLQNAIFAKAYQSDDLINEATDATTSDTKAITNALTIAAPEYAKLDGKLPELTKTITDAVSLIKKSRRDGSNFKELTAQFDIEKGAPVDEGTADLANFLDNNIRSAKRMGDGLSSLARQAHSTIQNSQNEGLFGAGPEPTVQGLINANDQIRQQKPNRATQTESQSTTSHASESNGRSEQQRKTPRGGATSGTGSVEEGTESRQPKLAKSGKPFKTESSARISRVFKETANAVVIPVDGGFGVQEGKVSTSKDRNKTGLTVTEQPSKKDDELIVEPPPHEHYSDVQKQFLDGKDITAENVKRGFERLVSDPDAAKTRLNKLTKKELANIINGHVYSDEKKAKLVERAYRSSISRYRFMGNKAGSFTSSSIKLDGIINETREHINSLNDESLKDYGAYLREQKEVRQKQFSEYKKRLTAPKTLKDFQESIQVLGKKRLSDEQLAQYDKLVAEKEMADKPAMKAGLSGEDKIELGAPEKSTHGKTGDVIFNVQAITRIDKDKFKEAANFARSLGGGYYRSNFYFKSREDAELFSGWMNGEDVDLTEQKEARNQAKKEKAETRLKSMAERLEQQATEKLNSDRKENTLKRMREADSARNAANNDLETANLLKTIAEKPKSVLKHLTQKVQVELFQQLQRTLTHSAPSDLKEKTADGRDYFKEDVSSEKKAQFVKMPLAELNQSLVDDVAKKMEGKKGFIQLSRMLAKKSKDSERGEIVALSPREIDGLIKFYEANKDEFQYSFLKNNVEDYKRLKRMGITSKPVLRAALLEFMDLERKSNKPAREQSKLDVLQRNLQQRIIGNRSAFNDFFPTPEATAKEVTELADIQDGMKVLEPSAGNGLLADAAKESGGNVDSVEIGGELREILKEKGHNLVGDDFLEHKDGDGSYDRVVMNPPFSNDQDIIHVAHAYGKLKPGGRLVAIVSSMAGERQNKRNKQFKNWLEELSADTQILPEDAFKSSLNPTGVRTKVLIIDKPQSQEIPPPNLSLDDKAGSVISGKKAEDIRKVVDPLIKQLHEENTFEVVQSVSDLPFAVRLQVKKQLSKSKGQNPTVRGVNAGDKNYLIADGIQDEKEAASIFLHEVVGHKAVLSMLGKEGDSIMERIAYSYGPKKLQSLIKAYGADFKTKEGRILLGKEKVAHMAESGERPSMMGKLVASVKQWLRRYFPNIKWSDNDIHNMLAAAKDQVENRYMVKVNLDSQLEQDSAKNKVNLSLRQEVPDDIEKIISDTQAKPKSQETLLDKAKDFTKKIKDVDLTVLKQGLIDSYAAIESLEKDVNAGKLLDGQESAYKAALRTANLDSVMEVMMRKGALEIKDGAFQVKQETKGLLEIFQPIADADQMQLWETWAGARRAKRIMQEDTATNSKGIQQMREHRAMVSRLKKTPPSEYRGGLSQWQRDMQTAKKGLEHAKSMAIQKRERNYTAAQIDRVQSYIESKPDLKKTFEIAHKEWITFNKSVLDMAEQAGLIDPDARKLWENDDYVPFHRASEALEADSFSFLKRKKGLSGQKSGIKKLSGGVEKLNILESMVRSTTHMVDASFKNLAMQRIAEIADGVAMEKLPSSKLDLSETKAMLKSMGYDSDNMDSDTLNIWAKQLERYQNAGKGTVSVSNNGQIERYQVTDPTLFRAITQLGPMRVSGIMKVFQIPKRILTTLVTADPGFMAANFIRDSLSTWVTVDAKTKPFHDALKGAAKSLRHSDSQWAMMAAGAGGGGYYDTAPESVRQHLSTLEKGGALHKPKQLWDAWMRIGHASENANRIAVYDAIIEEGGSVAEAAHQAQDVINFSKRGEWAATQALITMVPFMNARIQGLERLYRGAKENPKAFFMKGSIIMGAGLALLAANWDNEEYWDLPEWDRDANWHAWIDGKHIRIPKPFEVGAFFGTVPERAFEQLRKDADSKLLGQRMFSMITNTFAFDLTPQLVKPALDVAKNKNGFTDSPILSIGDQYRLPVGQYSPWTSETMKQIANSMPKSAPDWMRSPKRLEYLFKGYLGTLGGYALALSDIGTEAVVGVPTKPEMNISQLPVLKRFYKDGVESNKHTGRFYDMLKEVNSLNVEIKSKIKEHQTEEAKKLRMSNLKKLQLRAKLNRVAKELSTINARIKSIYTNKSMTASKKRELIDTLSVQRNEIVSDVSMRYYEIFR